MRSLTIAIASAQILMVTPLFAAANSQEVILQRERNWALAIQAQDASAMAGFLTDDYSLSIAVQGASIAVVPRTAWLEALKSYRTESFSIDDAHVLLQGGTAVVTMLYTQKASVHGQDRSGQFFLTDVWVLGPDGWRVRARYSSRPEPAATARP